MEQRHDTANCKEYSLQDLETLRQAAKAVCPSLVNAYALSDLPLLSAAAELLQISIPELPQALAKLGLSSTALDTHSKLSSACTLQRTKSAQGRSLLNLEHAQSDSVSPSNTINLNDNDALLHPSLELPTEPGTLDQTDLAQDAFDGHDQEATGDINWAEYAGDYGDFLLEDSLDPASWPFGCDQAWPPSAMHAGGISNHDADVHTSDPPGLLAGSASSSTSLGVRRTASSGPLRSSDRPSALGTPPTRPIATSLAAYNTNPTRATKPQPAVRGLILDARVRKEISDTRQRKACIRCRMQKLKCSPDPQSLHGPCLSCRLTANSIYRLPCLRYKIPDAPLFRYAMYNSSFYLDHPLIGEKYGDFCLPRVWVSSSTKRISALHHGGLRLEIEVRQFIPPIGEDATDDRSVHGAVARPMYTIPWAVADPDIEVRNLGPIVDSYIKPYIINLLKPDDNLVWPIYQEALRLMDNDPTDNLILNTMRLWTGARLADRGWRCFGSDNLGAETLMNQLRPPGWTPLPPYIDYQLVSIIMHRYLAPLRRKVLDQLQRLVKANKASNWYSIFLSCFVLLHSCEMTVVIIRKHAAKRKALVRYLIMELVRAVNAAAKILLAHFHYCCKGQVPFCKDFDWSSPTNNRMAQLDAQQFDFICNYVRAVHEREDIFKAVRRSDQYEAPYWFVSQLFESNWEPRESHEHSPLSNEAYIVGKDQLVTEKGATVPLDPFLRPDIEESVAKRPNEQPS